MPKLSPMHASPSTSCEASPTGKFACLQSRVSLYPYPGKWTAKLRVYYSSIRYFWNFLTCRQKSRPPLSAGRWFSQHPVFASEHTHQTKPGNAGQNHVTSVKCAIRLLLYGRLCTTLPLGCLFFVTRCPTPQFSIDERLRLFFPTISEIRITKYLW